MGCAAQEMLSLSPTTTGCNASCSIFQRCKIKLDRRTAAKGSVNWRKSNKLLSNSSSNHSIRSKIASVLFKVPAVPQCLQFNSSGQNFCISPCSKNSSFTATLLIQIQYSCYLVTLLDYVSLFLSFHCRML